MPQHDVASLNDLASGQMHAVEVEGSPILLFRDGDAVHAVGATCPHAGAPLAEGVRDGDRVICPWHKAVFCLRTGALLDPPAVDALPRYTVQCEGERVLVTLPAEEPAIPAPALDPRLFAIIGAGAAGALAAQTLRQEGFGGRIVMLDRENRVPYDRTLLSKYHLSGMHGDEKSPLQSQAFYREHAIERRTAEVKVLDATTRTIHCADGSSLTYDAALIATGADPALPPLPGAHLANAFLLRSRADADAILAQAERSERAVVLGASFIGMEVAASLRERGLEVTVVGRETAPFAKQFGAEIGNALVGLHRDNGVGFRLDAVVSMLAGETAVEAVVLGDGERVAADLVVIGFGVKPVTGFVRGVALNGDGSVTVDATLKAAEGLYAAGDVARFPYRGGAIRVEHWRVAEQHGRLAALSMMGRNVRYHAVPVFWTIQYMKQVTYIGHATGWDDIVVHGDVEKREFLAYYVKNGLVAAAAGMDRDQDTSALIALLQQREDWTAEALGSEPSRLLRS
jgi:apoptosis-inducing factor 3